MGTDDAEVAALVLAPHFDAVRDVFSEHAPEPGLLLDAVRKVKLVVEPRARDSGRHFAGCRQDGRLVLVAPQASELPIPTLVAILAHEFGHAADFLYPGRWECQRGKPAAWVRDPTSSWAKRWRKAWADRTHDQMEQDADSIAQAVVGKRIGYCGPCLLQCFGGPPRPAGLE